VAKMGFGRRRSREGCGGDNGIGMKAYYLQWNGHRDKMEWHRRELWKIMSSGKMIFYYKKRFGFTLHQGPMV
jgi:hypothetical protein